MVEFSKPGFFYLGKEFNPAEGVQEAPLLFDSKNLTTHAVCVGMTGSGKTGLGVDLLEEAGLNGIPAIIIDPKGDLGNLALTFPQLAPQDFLPWIDASEAERKGLNPERYSEIVAKNWREGLAKWGESGGQIQSLRSKVDIAIYTPASQAGIPLSILSSFSAPSDELLLDSTAMRDRVLSVTSSLLGLLGIAADPIKSREHILISTIIDRAWRVKKDLSLPSLIKEIQKPSFDKVGVFDMETFYPQKERLALSVSLNNLLASPGFQAWMEGEPLNIQNLLYSPEGKPRLAVLSIAHLSDSERMFFVTLLLNEMISWMRRQSGTSSLRALLYMDEIFGFFPPVSAPPSKLPMLTLLKQARAFGLGVVLATQNPVDLDYKGLANCGTWFIGKLQTERDRMRVLEGLNTASNGELDSDSLSKMIASCGNRVFILRSVYLQDPLLFQTRWSLSYLRGPLTLPQIQNLMKGGKRNVSESTPHKLDETPSTPLGILEYYVVPKSLKTVPTYTPRVLGIGKLHFVDSKNRINAWQQVRLIASVDEDQVLWENAEELDSSFNLEKGRPAVGNFEEISPLLTQPKNYNLFSKALSDFLYQNRTYNLFESKDFKMSSHPAESEAHFRDRVADASKAQMADEENRIRSRYASKIKTLQDKILRAQNKAEAQKSQVGQRKIDALLSAGATILGALLGRGVSKGSITNAGTSIRKAGQIGKEQEDVTRVEGSLSLLQQQLRDLQTEMESSLTQLRESYNPDNLIIEKNSIHPRKSDISIETIALVWIPNYSYDQTLS